MKKLFSLLMITAICLGLSSCFLTKKKCDCPKFGMHKAEKPGRNS